MESPRPIREGLVRWTHQPESSTESTDFSWNLLEDQGVLILGETCVDGSGGYGDVWVYELRTINAATGAELLRVRPNNYCNINYGARGGVLIANYGNNGIRGIDIRSGETLWDVRSDTLLSGGPRAGFYSVKLIEGGLLVTGHEKGEELVSLYSSTP
nr:Unknown Function [uncultured bacterium]